MKRGALTLTVALGLAALVGCDEGPTPPVPEPAAALVPAPVQVVLPLGQEVVVDGGPLRLVFTRLVGDSRCPVDVTCVWAGNAEVEVGITAGSGPTVPLRINSTLEPRAAVWNGIRVAYVELLPRPRVQDPTDPDAYVLRVRLEAVDG